jgi:hypothetical protein
MATTDALQLRHVLLKGTVTRHFGHLVFFHRPQSYPDIFIIQFRIRGDIYKENESALS